MQKARAPILFGLWVFIFTFLIGGAWTGLAPLNSASGAIGIVVTTSKKQVVQYRDGGILKAVYVKEGDHVKVGQIVAQMDDSVLASNVSSLRAQKVSHEREVEIAQENLRSFKILAEQGYAAKIQLLETEKALIEQQSRLDETKRNLAAHEESLNRTTLKSPINGIVTQIDVNTIGSTMTPGQTLMAITPTEEELIIEAYIPQGDIESVHVGLKAKIKIAAFKHRSVGSLDGIVTYVSHDVLDYTQANRAAPDALMMNIQTQQQHGVYKVKISVDKEDLKKISKYKDYELAPGMQASVQIVTGERTLLQYLLDPVFSAVWSSLNER